MENKVIHEYFECHCSTPAHRLVFTLDTEKNEPPELSTEVYLDNHRNFFQRIWLAIKYTFGYKCQYGMFANFSLNPEDTNRLQDIISCYIDKHNLFVKTLKENANKR